MGNKRANWQQVLVEHKDKLQLLSGFIGAVGMLYGLQVLMVERTMIPFCSAEVLAAVGEESLLAQQQVTVEVAGAVVEAGVWKLGVGSRVADALEKAGGLSARADRTFTTQNLNLARTLVDGERLYIPFTGENLNRENNGVVAGISTTNTKISVNDASEKELQTLPGIGQARAAKIIENRPYQSLQELVSKQAISETLLDGLSGLVSL